MQSLTRIALSAPRTTLVLAFVFTLAAAFGLPRTTSQVGYRGMLGSEHPSVVTLDRHIERFSGGLPVIAVWQCGQSPCETIFDDEAIWMAHTVEQALERHPLVLRVESPVSAGVTLQTDDGVAVRQFVERGQIPPDRDALARRASDDVLWHGYVASPDGRTGAILVQIDSTDSDTASAVVPALREALAPYEAKGFVFHLAGDPVDFVVAGGEMRAEAPRLAPIMLLLIGLVVFLLTRSLLTAGLAIGASSIAVLWAMGVRAWLGWPEIELSQALPPTILVIGLCDAIHFLSRYRKKVAGCGELSVTERERSLLDSAREVGGACLATSLTTSAAFLSFFASSLDSFARFGAIAAAGVMFALLLTFTLLPVVLARIRTPRLQPEGVQQAWDDALKLLTDTVERQHKPILGVAASLALLSLFGLTRLQVDIDEHELLGQGSQVVRWADFVEDHLRRPDSLEIGLELPEGRLATEPAIVSRIASLTNHLAGVEGLGRPTSYLDYLAPMNRLLHDDDPAWARPAKTREGNAQLLLMLEMDFQPLVNDWVSPDLRHLRISVDAENLSTQERRQVLTAVSTHLDQTLPPDWQVTTTGPLAVYLDLVEEVQQTQLRSFTAAVLVIALLFFLYMRVTGSSTASSTRWMFIGLVPSIFPVLCIVGTMGLLGVPLDAGTAMVAAIVLGIAVDDSFHIIAAHRAKRRAGLEPTRAMSEAVRTVGRALVTTSFAVAMGFFSLTFSSWQAVASFGFLAGFALLTALIADLVLLPAIVTALARSDGEVPVEPLAPSRVLGARGRAILTMGLVVTVVGTLALAFPDPRDHEAHPRLGCWIYPNGVVSLTSGMDSACPLELRDRISYLEVEGQRYRVRDPGAFERAVARAQGHVTARVERGQEHLRVEIPVVVDTPVQRTSRFTAAAVLCFAALGVTLFLVWRSSSIAVVPYGALYAALCVLSTYILCSRSNELPGAVYVFAATMVTPILYHLALTFPQQRAIVRRVPGLLYLIYGVGLAISCPAVYSYLRHPGLWLQVSGFVTMSIGITWAMLIVSSSIARRDAVTALERARANSSFWGTLAIPLGCALAMRTGGFDNVTLAAVGALLIPLPVGWAMTRHQLYDVRPHARQLAFSAAFSLVYTALLTLAWFVIADRPLTDRLPSNAASQLGLIFLVLLGAELLRSQIWKLLRRKMPSVEAHLRDFEEGTTRDLRRLNSEEDTVKLLAESIQRGLDTTGVSVFLKGEHGWRPAAARGERPSGIQEVEPWLEELEVGDRPVHLALEGGAVGTAADRLRQQQLAIVSPLRCRGELLAILLVNEARDRMPYTLTEVEFVGRLCSHTAVAIYNARLNAELLRVERYSTIGRIATGLMHDIGKPMSIVWQRAKQMAGDPAVPDATREVAGVMATMTDEALSSIDRLMEHAREGLAGPVEQVSAAEIIERAVASVSRIHENRRICVRLTPDLPRVTGSDELHLALVNLLDNALLASDPDEVTDVFAAADSRELTIQVIDRGCGMPPEVLEHAFDPFFTTRAGKGGSGIGLAASRTTVERLGGSVTIDSAEGFGTTVTIRLAL